MLGDKLAELRKKKGLTQADLAAYLQISRQAYSTYEVDKHEMDLQTLGKLADFYGVSIDYLFGRYDSNPFLLGDEDEIALIKDYRRLDARGKGSVRATLAFELSQGAGTAKKQAM
ncbi:MAG: helix-turn-helix domain-containing protein [Oscillospiraceae bacterium]|jgi:transcriptional regulator with XRE-family HTH domain|nr:helix-turn-helix domain-containing protein [Oscillospiraceae bacterium]